jgi:hypothetical protein
MGPYCNISRDRESCMNKISSIFILVCMALGWAAFPGLARVKSSAPSLLSNNGFVLLHPYFSGRPWKETLENLSIVDFPDTFSGNQPLRPIVFDASKNVDTAVAVFIAEPGALFFIQMNFTPYYGACEAGEIRFNKPQKIPAAGIAITGKTPVYLIKDQLFSADSIKIVVGPSSSSLFALTVKLSNNNILKIDTLPMQGAGAIVQILGDYSQTAKRDTCIWALGANGTIRMFSYASNAWGNEQKWDISASSDTVKCLNGVFAGTSSGKIYRKNASQSFTLANSNSTKAIHAMYPEGAVGALGNVIDHTDSVSWRLFPHGSATYTHAHFIRRPGGFGVELLDADWKYDVFTYRDSASKISFTIPGDKKAYVNNGTWTYPVSYSDTGATIYFLDPDSNYKDIDMTLKRRSLKVPLDSNGTARISSIPDSETCHLGIARLTTGIVSLKLQQSLVSIKANVEVGSLKPDCGCYWKKSDFTINSQWSKGDTIFIKAGKDVLKIANDTNPPVTATVIHPMEVHEIKYVVSDNRIVFRVKLPKFKSISLFDISGRQTLFQSDIRSSSISIPLTLFRRMMVVELAFSDGTVRRITIPAVR